MGSVNPLVLLPEILKQHGEAIAEGLFQSVTLGFGQFCTCPGLVLAVEDPALDRFAQVLRAKFQAGQPGAMLTPSIARSYRSAVARISGITGLTAYRNGEFASRDGVPVLFETTGPTFLGHEDLRHEVFGPATVLVRCESSEQLLELAKHLEGSLTATIHGTPRDLGENRPLLALLTRKAGRLVFNGFPTGVEVCASMQHGGPYPATTDPRFTSVGSTAIERFARPVTFQDCPPEFLPPELQAL
jgi:NADP-dependent aldehyde dehydrogenase